MTATKATPATPIHKEVEAALHRFDQFMDGLGADGDEERLDGDGKPYIACQHCGR